MSEDVSVSRFTKAYFVLSMTILMTSYPLLLKHTRSYTQPQDLYFSTTVVFLAEITKLCVSLFMLYKGARYSFSEYKSLLKQEFLWKPRELAKMSVPSIVYAIQNNLDFVALANLDASVYQVTIQLKVVTTAVFMVVLLGKSYSCKRWCAIVLVFMGVACVQLDAVKAKQTNSTSVEGKPSEIQEANYMLGMVSVFITCLTAGFAGVYFEKMLKDGSNTPFWIRNLQMYSCGVLSAALACTTEATQIIVKGPLHGYNTNVVIIVGVLSLGGLYISLVMKHLDNLIKSFGSAISIILVSLLSWYLFASPIGIYFVIGSCVVCSAILLYNSVPN